MGCAIESGPPSPPDLVVVEEVTDSTAQLSWSPGQDNGSPITGYVIQARTPFTVGWQAVETGTSSPITDICHCVSVYGRPTDENKKRKWQYYFSVQFFFVLFFYTILTLFNFILCLIFL